MHNQNKIINLIINEVGIGKDEAKPESDLKNNLGIDGDDGYELVEKFNQIFHINPPLDPKKYFNSEYFSWKELWERKEPLSIGDLVRIAKIYGS